MAGINIVHVPYKSSTSALTDLVSGQIHMAFDNSLVSYSRNGTLRPLGVASLKRSSAWPELPSVAEQELPGYESTVWYGVVAPAKTSPAIVRKLNAEINKALLLPDVKEQLKKMSGDPLGGSPGDFEKRSQTDSKKWEVVIKTTGVKNQ
jgi:tripartite-type tricarboxylate transporter receptor subunit TctC